MNTRKYQEKISTKTYKKRTKKSVVKPTSILIKISKELSICNRIERMRKNESYITLKDYKPRFPNKKTCQLINHSKSDIGETSKSNLNRINQRVLAATKVNRWKNTSSTLEGLKILIKKKTVHSLNLVLKISTI